MAPLACKSDLPAFPILKAAPPPRYLSRLTSCPTPDVRHALTHAFPNSSSICLKASFSVQPSLSPCLKLQPTLPRHRLLDSLPSPPCLPSLLNSFHSIYHGSPSLIHAPPSALPWGYLNRNSRRAGILSSFFVAVFPEPKTTSGPK